MFTGIIEEIGTIQTMGGGMLRIGVKLVLDGLHVGDSIAVNGVCLTVTDFDAQSFTADVMPETFRRTSLGALAVGSAVNLERALTLTGRLGGHIVSGHIDGTGQILTVQEEKNARVFRIAAPSAILYYIVEKGSVALDGVSLTVAAVTEKWFSVSLIPHTRQVTTLHAKKPGGRINIETDIVGKYTEKFLRTPRSPDSMKAKKNRGLTREFLTQYGF